MSDVNSMNATIPCLSTKYLLSITLTLYPWNAKDVSPLQALRSLSNRVHTRLMHNNIEVLYMAKMMRVNRMAVRIKTVSGMFFCECGKE